MYSIYIMSKFLLDKNSNFLKNDLSNITASATTTINTIVETSLLDDNGKIKLDLIPSIAISTIYVVNTIIDRDNIQNIETGDVVKVIENNEIYMYTGVEYIQINSTFIETLGDVQIDLLTHNDVLMYDANDLKFKNKQLELKYNMDIEINTLTINNNQTLIYNTVNSKFENQYITLYKIQDIIINSPQTSDLLKYNSFSSSWENFTPYIPLSVTGPNNSYLKIVSNVPTWTVLPAILPININNPLLNQELKYDGTNWINYTPSGGGGGSPLTTIGDIYYRNNLNVDARLPLGTANQILKSDGSNVVYTTDWFLNSKYDVANLSNIISSNASLIYGSGSVIFNVNPQGTRTTSTQNLVDIGVANRCGGSSNNCILIGQNNGNTNMLGNNILIGSSAGFNANASVSNNISIGNLAGRNCQGDYMINIGYATNFSNSANSQSIVINGTSGAVQAAATLSTVIKPIRSLTLTLNTMFYNSTSGEISYNASVSSSIVKKDIENIVITEENINDFKLLSMKKFNFLNESNLSDNKNLGFIAEEIALNNTFHIFNKTVEEVYIGEEKFTNLLGVDYDKLTRMLIPLLQQAFIKIDNLTQRIQTLESLI